MTPSPFKIVNTFSWYEYPTAGAAGLFLCGIGIGFVFVWLFPRYYSVFVGLSFGLAALGAYVGYVIFPDLGNIRIVDIVVYSFCLLAEIGGIIWANIKVKDERKLEAITLLIVALHFLPMVIILSPLILFFIRNVFCKRTLCIKTPSSSYYFFWFNR